MEKSLESQMVLQLTVGESIEVVASVHGVLKRN